MSSNKHSLLYLKIIKLNYRISYFLFKTIKINYLDFSAYTLLTYGQYLLKIWKNYMKKNTIIILFCIFSIYLNAGNILFLLPDEPIKSDYYRTGLNYYIDENLKKADIKRFPELEKKLRINHKRDKSIFLASKSLQSGENEFSKTVLVDITNRFGIFYCKIEIYSVEKMRLVTDKEIIGSRRNLVKFYNDITQEIISGLEIYYQAENIFSIKKSNILNDYLKALYYYKKGNFRKVYNSLIYYNNANSHPEIQNLIQESQKQLLSDSTVTLLGKEINIIFDDLNSDDQLLFSVYSIIKKGYSINLKNTKLSYQGDDSNYVDISLEIAINFRSGIKRRLIELCKKNNANLNFAGMGNYEFSKSDSDNEKFINLLLSQKIILKLFDSKNEIIAKDEVYISRMDYNKGYYSRGNKSPFPLTPGSSAGMSFTISNNLYSTLNIKDIDRDELNDISGVELLFSVNE